MGRVERPLCELYQRRKNKTNTTHTESVDTDPKMSPYAGLMDAMLTLVDLYRDTPFTISSIVLLATLIATPMVTRYQSSSNVTVLVTLTAAVPAPFVYVTRTLSVVAPVCLFCVCFVFEFMYL